jgi:TolB protein
MRLHFFSRSRNVSLIPLALFALVSSVASTAGAQGVSNAGEVVIDSGTVSTPIRVSGATQELNALANQAFSAHGAFRRQAQGFAFDVKFAPAGGPNQVQVTVTRASGAQAVSQVVSGSTPRQALLRAADVAVRAMSGKPGFFASRLAFIGERTGKPEVYTSDLFLGEVRQITNDKALALTPRWSPDGSRLLYTSYFRTGSPDIFLLDLGSLQRNSFVSFKGTNSGARFSPDGRNVAMVLSGEGNPEIYVGNAQGRQITRKTRTRAIESSPCFSPDGSQLVFTSDAAGGPQIYIMPAAGGEARRLPTRLSGYCAEPDWSKADPSKIAFTAKMGRNFQIAVYDIRSGVAKVVSKAPFDAVEPSWLADGRHVVFTARAANSSSIWILDTESGRSAQLSSASAGKVFQPSVLDPR